MRPPRILILALAVAVSAFSLGCSDDDDPPPTGGGGGPTEPFDSGVFNSGVFVHTYANVGTFGYHCTVHGVSMSGTVNVIAGTPDSTTVAILNNSYNPTPATVHQGGYVKWIANGTNHAVPSP